MTEPCTYPDCRLRGPQYAHTLCKNCYDRLLYRPPARAGSVKMPSAVGLVLAQAGRGPEDCWPWPGYVDEKGYGQVGNGWAHRFAVERAGIELPPGHDVDHECHNRDGACPGGSTCPHRRCVNFRHLVVRPLRENRADTAPFRSETCSNGHLKSEYRYQLSSGVWRCRACDRDAQLRRSALKAVTQCA